MGDLPPLKSEETLITPGMVVCTAIAAAIIVAASAITLHRPTPAPAKPLLPEQVRGTDDLWQGTPQQAIMARWPPDQMPAWAVDTFDPAPGPVPIPLPRPRPEEPR